MNIKTIYRYEDRFGRLLYEVLRLEPKNFRQRRPDGTGDYIWSLDGVERVPYRLPELLGSAGEIVFVPEGERDVEELRNFGLTATTASGGADGTWTPSMLEFLRARDVVILVDNDGPGWIRGTKLAELLQGVARSVKVVALPGPEHSDVSDWFDAGHTLQEFHDFVAATPLEPPPQAAIVLNDESGWPDPIPLRPELPAVPLFNLEWLPSPLQPLVEEIALGMQTPPDFGAAAIITALAGITGRRIQVRPKYADTSWEESAVLWGCLIAPAGSLKTPALARVVKPLNKIECEWRSAEKLDQEVYQEAKALIAIEQQQWEQAVKQADKDNKPRPPRPESTIWEPDERRIVLTDITYESLHVVLSKNPGGIFVVRDELTGFLASLEQENRLAERPFWLSLWSGAGFHAIDRIGRGHIHVENVCGSLFGCLVPESAKRLVAAMASGKSDDGFLQRFSLAVWPDQHPVKWIDRPTDANAAWRWENVVRQIIALSASDPLIMNFNPEAQEIFIDWYEKLQVKVHGDELHPSFQSHLAKYPKALVVIAAIFELAELADSGKLTSHAAAPAPYATRVRRSIHLESEPGAHVPAPTQSTLISVTNIQRAISILGYAEKHAVRLYSSVTSPQLRAAHALERHLRRGDLGAKFTKRDVQRRNWTDLSEPELIGTALQDLADLHYIRPVPVKTTEKGGRPSLEYEVSPKVSK